MTMKCDRIDKMKKQFFFGFAIIAMLSACSGEEALVESGEVLNPSAPTNVVVQNSDVEIKLSPNANPTTSGGTMRGAILSDPSDSTFALDGLGVFGLAYAKQSESSIAEAVNWTTSGNAYNICLNNVLSNAVKVDKKKLSRDGDGNIVYDNGVPVYETVKKDDGITPEKVTEIHWADGLTRYYPMGGWYKYNFYAYYPKVDNARIERANGQLNATMDIDGTTDIIWGRTRPNAVEQAQNAYSASYFRNDDNADTIPILRMKHVLTRFRFKAYAGEPFPTGENVESQGIKIVDIKVHNVPQSVTLAVARQNEATHGWDTDASTDTEGTLSQMSSTMQELHLKEEGVTQTQYGGYLTNPYALLNSHNTTTPLYINTGNTAEDTVGDGIMLPAGNMSYALTVTMIDNTYDGTESTLFKNEEPFTLVIPDGGYLPGRSYWIELTINPRKEITARATLIPWQEADAPIGLEF